MKVAEPTVERLVQYHRLLDTLHDEGHRVVSSKQMGELLGIKASQVRKDLSYFGEMGKRGVGYSVDKLNGYIMDILSSPRTWRAALVGVGNLGGALLRHIALRNAKVEVVALFDIDAGKVGRTFGGVECRHVDDMTSMLRESEIDVLIMTVPVDAAQSCADKAVESGAVRGILAFTPGSFTVPEGIIVYKVDLVAELEKLLFYMKQRDSDLHDVSKRV